MAATAGMIGGGSSLSTASFGRRLDGRRSGRRSGRVCMSIATSTSKVANPYDVLQIERDASESDVKKAFRRLALKYHPDVCKGDNCKVQFHQINEAYDVVMEALRGELSLDNAYASGIDESFRGMNDDDWDLWEEWMGWEGAGIRDYSSHINPYI